MSSSILCRSGVAAALLLIVQPAPSEAYVVPQTYRTSAYTSPTFFYQYGESIGPTVVPVATANWDLYVDRRNPDLTWTSVASSRNGTGALEYVTYRAPANNYYRYRVVFVSGSGGYYVSLASEVVLSIAVSVSLSTGQLILPAARPVSTRDVAVYVRNPGGTTVASANAGGNGYIETLSYAAPSAGTYTVAFTFLSGSGKATASFNKESATTASGVSKTFNIHATDSNRLKSVVTGFGVRTKDHLESGIELRHVSDTPTSSNTGLQCDWTVGRRSTVTEKMPNQGVSEKRSRSGSIFIERPCSTGLTKITASANFAYQSQYCVAYTGCICRVELEAGPFAEGSITGTAANTASGSFTLGASFTPGVHCGLHWVACGYGGGKLKAGFRLSWASGVPTAQHMFGSAGVQWHAMILGAGPFGTATWTRTYPL